MNDEKGDVAKDFDWEMPEWSFASEATMSENETGIWKEVNARLGYMNGSTSIC